MGDAAHSPVNSNPAPISEGIASSSAVYQPTADTPSASEPVRSGPYQHTAFSAQFQMPHSQITCGPFHMSHMVGSLPSSGFRPGQPRYGGQPGTGQMGPMGPMPPGNSHPYYMHQHSPMAYYAPSPISPSQQRDRAGVQPGYYHGQMVMGNSQPMGPGYYYPPTTHYTRGQSQGFQSLNDSALASQSAALSKRGDRPASGIKGKPTYTRRLIRYLFWEKEIWREREKEIISKRWFCTPRSNTRKWSSRSCPWTPSQAKTERYVLPGPSNLHLRVSFSSVVKWECADRG